jgi:hypothetical protein
MGGSALDRWRDPWGTCLAKKTWTSHCQLSPEKIINENGLILETKKNRKLPEGNRSTDWAEIWHIILIYLDDRHIQKSAHSDAQVLCNEKENCEY